MWSLIVGRVFDMSDCKLESPGLASYLPLIELAYNEDFGSGDVTSEATIAANEYGRGELVFRQSGVLCGMVVVEQVLRRYDDGLQLSKAMADGSRVDAGATVGVIEGPLRGLLAAERVMLNFMQRLSGISTITARYVEAIASTSAKVCDTRKTTPGWRVLEKYAVLCGGGVNHRMGLHDAVLIKDNHIAAMGINRLRDGLEAAIKSIGKSRRNVAFVQVEVDTLEQLRVVLEVEGIDMVLLDNMSPDELAKAVRIRDESGQSRRVLLEASGSVTLETIGDVANSGVDRISVGALTHSVRSLDIALDMR